MIPGEAEALRVLCLLVFDGPSQQHLCRFLVKSAVTWPWGCSLISSDVLSPSRMPWTHRPDTFLPVTVLILLVGAQDSLRALHPVAPSVWL